MMLVGVCKRVPAPADAGFAKTVVFVRFLCVRGQRFHLGRGAKTVVFLRFYLAADNPLRLIAVAVLASFLVLFSCADNPLRFWAPKPWCFCVSGFCST